MIPEYPDQPDFAESSNPWIRVLVNIERAFGSALLVGTLVLVLIQVVSRYVFSTPFTWSEELARFALIWLTFIGAGFVMARRKHVAVDLVAAKLSKRGAIAVDSFAMLVVMTVATTMSIAGTQFTLFVRDLNAPATQIPMSFVYGAAVLGFALIFLHGAINTYVNIKHPDQVPGAMENLELEAF